LLAITTPGYWWTGYLVAAFLGCSYVCTGAGVSGLLPQLVPGELLGHANSLLQSFRQGLRLVGPLAGILVYKRFGVGAVTAADTASFIIAAIIFSALKADKRIPSPRPRRGAADLTEGARYLFKNRPLRVAVVAIAPFAVTCGVTGAATYAIVTVGIGKPAEFVGYMTSVMGIGAIAGGLLAARMIERLGELGTIGVGVIAYGVGSAGLAAPSVPLALVSMMIAGIGITLPVIGRLTLMQRRTPPEIMGRVSFAWDSVGTGVQLISMAACASLLAITDFRYVLVPAALVSVLGGVHALASRAKAARSLPA
jgi:MFS family permease